MIKKKDCILKICIKDKSATNIKIIFKTVYILIKIEKLDVSKTGLPAQCIISGTVYTVDKRAREKLTFSTLS